MIYDHERGGKGLGGGPLAPSASIAALATPPAGEASGPAAEPSTGAPNADTPPGGIAAGAAAAAAGMDGAGMAGGCNPPHDSSHAPSAANNAPPGVRVPAPLAPHSLKATWEATQHSTRADWHEWMRRLAVEMLRESPSAPLRACAPLAEAYQPLARELFNAAFLSCWSALGVDGYQESLVKSLETALGTENMSLEVLQPLLNLAGG